jgi:hypothetical protein
MAEQQNSIKIEEEHKASSKRYLKKMALHENKRHMNIMEAKVN